MRVYNRDSNIGPALHKAYIPNGAAPRCSQLPCVSNQHLGCRQAVWLRSRRSHRPWLPDMSPAPDRTLLPPGFGELRLLSKEFVMWGGVDGRAICATLEPCNLSRSPRAAHLCCCHARRGASVASSRHPEPKHGLLYLFLTLRTRFRANTLNRCCGASLQPRTDLHRSRGFVRRIEAATGAGTGDLLAGCHFLCSPSDPFSMSCRATRHRRG